MNFKLLSEFVKKYQWRNLFFSYGRIMLVAFAVPFIAFFLIFVNVYDQSHKDELEQLATVSAVKSREKISLLENEIDNFFYSILSNESVGSMLASKDPKPTTIYNQEHYYKINSKMHSFKTEYDFIDSVFIYSIKSEYVFSTEGGFYLQEHPLKHFIESCLNERTQSHKINVATNAETGEKVNCMSLIYMLNTQQYNVPDGIMIININSKNLAEYIADDYTNEQIMVLSFDGELLYAPDNVSTEEYVPFYKSSINELQFKDYLTQEAEGSIICYFPNENLGMTTAIRVPIESMNTEVNYYVGAVIGLVILLMLVIISISTYTSMAMHISVSQMISDIDISKVQKSKKSGISRFLSDKFSTVMNNDVNIKEQIESKVSILKQNRALALQTQINPHFLFNTLHLVNLMIMKITGDDNEPSRIITLLSDLLNDTLRSNEYTTSLENEISFAEKYIEIEQIKHKGTFEFKVNIDESLKNCMVVKFILQPVLENCIIHGFKKNKGGNVIELSAHVVEDRLVISIKDNGNGVSAEQAEKINARLAHPDRYISSRNIGLDNVNGRVKLMCGENYGVRIIPADCGTVTEIYQPYIPSEE